MSVAYDRREATGDLGVKHRFPTLQRTVGDHPLVYLDCAATSLRPDTVIDAGCHFCRMHDGNPHRGMHALSYEATQVYESSRAEVARWLDAPSDVQVVITRNATAAINLVAGGLRGQVGPGDNIVLTRMEHHANLIPWQRLCAQTGAELRFAELTADGQLDMASLRSALDARTKVVAAVHVSNVLGTINPVADIVQEAHRVGALVLVDGAQSVGHMPVSLADMGADFFVFSAHKCYGPAGLGFLLGREEALERIEPIEFGGDMIEYVTYEDATWASIPQRFEAGTANSQAVAAFPEAIAFISEIGQERIADHDALLARYAIEQLGRFRDVRILGPGVDVPRGGLVSFYDPWVPPHDISTIVDQRGVAVRAGHHCAQPLHRHLGIPASTRLSFGVYTTIGDIDAFVDALRAARRLFAGEDGYGH